MKICKKCKLEKELSEFKKHSRYKGGYTPQCKKCYYDSSRETKAKWYLKNKDAEKARMKKWKEVNKDHWNEYMVNYRKSDKFSYKTPNNRFNRAKRRALEKQCTPKWVDNSHQEKIKKIFNLAAKLSKTTGIKYQVDHIYPINNKLLSGLHVWWNLQILPEKVNKSKSNKIKNIKLPRVSDNFEEYLTELKMYADLVGKEQLELEDKKPLG